MGRQKTLWIDEDCWKKLEAMEGESISEKVRRCINAMDISDDARVESLRKRINLLEAKLKSVGWKGDDLR